MAARQWKPILEQIRSLAARPNLSVSDGELLSRFIARRDEAAFEALLRRHGPMVLRVARRILGSEPDAEDVFQATFLLLARRAGAIHKRESVASWLHGVAHRLALSARAERARRHMRERRAAEMRPMESPPKPIWSELEETLHDVLSQLPAKYRTPLVYCYLEGWTQEEVARQLGKPLGTVRSWLARGRELLRKRLLRRGISLSVEGASAALLASACTPAEAVPVSLRMATIQAAHLLVAGGSAMTLISSPVAALVRKGLMAMLAAKLKSGAAWVLAVAVLVAGTGWGAHRTFRAKPLEVNEAAEKAPPKQAAFEDRSRTDAFGDPLPPGAVARLGTIRFRHEDSRSWEFAVAPDGRSIATASGRSLILWDIVTGRQLRRVPFNQTICCLAFAPDGKFAVIGGEDCILHRIDLTSGKEVQRFVGHEAVSDPHAMNKGIGGVAFSSDGRELISWGSDKTVRVWDAGSGKQLRQLSDKDFGSKDCFISGLSPDGKLLAVSKPEVKQTSLLQRHVEVQLQLWNLKTGKEVQTGKEVRERTYPHAGVAFSPDSKVLAITQVNWDRGVRIVLLNPESGKELRATRNEMKYGVGMLALSPDGKILTSAASVPWRGSRFLQPCIHFWDAGSMKELRTAAPSPDSFYSIVQLAFSPDGKTLISRSGENHVRLWDVASGKERIIGEGANQAIYSLAYSPNAKLVASASGTCVWLWSVTTGKRVQLFTDPDGTSITAVAFSADGKWLASANPTGTICFWDAETGKEQRRIRIAGGGSMRMALASDGETIASCLFDGARISLWDARTGKKRRDLELPPRGNLGGIMFLQELHFSPDGKILYAISGSHRHVLRWDAASGKALPSFGERTGSPNGMAISPDGRSVAVITGGGGIMTPKGIVSWDGELYLWETATGQRRLFTKNIGYATSVAFAPDGRLLALINPRTVRVMDGEKETVVGLATREQVRLVRSADGKIIRRFTGHLGGINCVNFSPDGRTLASGGQDTTVLLWDVTDRAVPRGKETPPLKPEKLAELWKGLSGTAAEAYGCMNSLISVPRQTVPFLSEKLKPVAVLDAKRFARLLKKLESDQFTEREEATQELKKLGDATEPALRKALQEKLPLETRRRVQALLDELDSSERLRSLRAIEILERIGDQAACDFLRRLSDGAAGAWLTEEARMTLQRLQRRGK